ncbi:uncharacterized protein PFL1_04368 [Pseudozyma flocculosa PF-1]|uniref:Uncharacterized protein n=1 Tax=Pseudozyma flocculosa PF-1 TaxID=1277687 RepID=A0A061HBS9_9BASI|nr:uncharacterized protein PFL1_04368 [Pseudozyma flocculosa PF-1]EPQ28041.1 hypothetical protein PFL1_04368 [Pseudozyma flocculosa PF-1]
MSHAGSSTATATAAAASTAAPADLYDLTLRTHQIVERFLSSNGYDATAEQLRRDAAKAGLEIPATSASTSYDPGLDLGTLVESYNSTLRAAQQRRLKASLDATHSSRSVVDPLTLTLPGPSQLPFRLVSTHRTLHASNILSITRIPLPRRSFDTSARPPRFRNSSKPCIVTTAADKRIVFSDAESGEVEEILEGDGDDVPGHRAAVLAVAQDPGNPRCLVSAGMDAKVVVWDLMTRKPVQSLSHHAKFAVRLAFSPSGEYLASAGYDRKIIVYRRRPVPAAAASRQGRAVDGSEAEEDEDEVDDDDDDNDDGDDDDDDDDEEHPSVGPDAFEKVFELETKTNPESIIFVRAAVQPSSGEVQEIEARGGDEILVRHARRQRTWLAFTVRNDSFLHYLPLPLSADASGEGAGAAVEAGAQVDGLTDQLAATELGEEPAETTRDWHLVSFNTNPNPEDLHVSYSLLSLSLDPSGLYICAQTGDHTPTNLNTSSSSAATGPLSRLLLLPLLSSRRAGTVWTGIATSSYATPRHSWLPSGRGIWLNSEDGVLRLVDLRGKVRAQVLCHGLVESTDAEAGSSAAAAVATTTTDEAQRVVSWSRGGNTIIKDVVALDERSVASCGFDRTVRVLRLDADCAL